MRTTLWAWVAALVLLILGRLTAVHRQVRFHQHLGTRRGPPCFVPDPLHDPLESVVGLVHLVVSLDLCKSG